MNRIWIRFVHRCCEGVAAHPDRRFDLSARWGRQPNAEPANGRLWNTFHLGSSGDRVERGLVFANW